MWSVMLNVANDFWVGSWFDPYIGVGAGYARITFHHYGARPAGGSHALTTSFIDDTDGGAVYQGFVGFRSELTSSLALDFNWRYVTADSPRFTNSAGKSVHSDYTTEAVMVGLSYSF
jgi:opacity protein-like surface antigen